MNRKFISILLISLSVTAGSCVYAMNKHYTKIISSMSEEISTMSSSIETLNSDILALRDEVSLRDTRISELEEEMSTITEDRDRLLEKINEMNREVSYSPYDLMSASNATGYHLAKALEGTELSGLADAFVEAEETTGVNAFLLASIAAWESSWGTSHKATFYNNLTGFAVYNSRTKGAEFDSKTENIITTAELLARDYLNPGGIYYSGKSIWDVNYRYCLTEDSSQPDYAWSEGIISIASSLVNKANAQ